MARLAAVIGSPVRHSLSPAMHNAVFRAGDLDWTFERFDVVDGGVPAAIAAMAPLDIGGYAVTMPHKQAAARAVDAIDPAAAVLDSVNTVVLRPDGTTFGANTDGAGFVAWVQACGLEIEGVTVAVLGAGATARSIIDALGRNGAGDIAIVNRTASAATHAGELAESARVGAMADVATARLVVNATSVGMGSARCPIDVSLLHARQVVADVVYHPLETTLLAAAAAVGAKPVDGLGMLVHQAVLQQELWTGRKPAPSLLRSAAEAELASRSR